MTPYNAPPHDLILDVLKWLRDADYPGGGIYPNFLGEVFDDRAEAVWVAGRYTELWQVTEPHNNPMVKHGNIKHAIFSEIQAIKHGATPPVGPPVPPPRPPAGGVSPLTIDAGRRWFRHADGLFDYREVSAFGLLSLWIAGRRDEAMAWIDQMLAERFTVFRVLYTLDGGYWGAEALRLTGRSLHAKPAMQGYWEGALDLPRYLASRGAYIRVCLIGAVEPFGGVWYPDRRDVWQGSVRDQGEAFSLRLVDLLRDETNVILEQANEPLQIGLRHSADSQVALGHRLKRSAPARLLAGGAMDGGDDQRVDYAGPPFDYVDAHIERRQHVGGFEWVKRSGEYTLIDQPQVWPEHHPQAGQPTGIKEMPFVSGEPINFGDWRLDGRNDDVERSPSVALAYAACSRARKFNTCFHFDAGLWCTPVGALTLAHMRAYHAALDAFPMTHDGKWRGGWAPEQGNYWDREQWPPTDGTDDVVAHVRAGRGPWRVFGCGAYSMTIAEPKGWDYRRGLQRGVEVERLAFCETGVFNAGVYVRRG